MLVLLSAFDCYLIYCQFYAKILHPFSIYTCPVPLTKTLLSHIYIYIMGPNLSKFEVLEDMLLALTH